MANVPAMSVDYEKRGPFAIVKINRPEARNAVNGTVANGIEDAIDQIEADDSIWVGILTGAGMLGDPLASNPSAQCPADGEEEAHGLEARGGARSGGRHR